MVSNQDAVTIDVFAIASNVLLDGNVCARVTEIRIVEGRVVYGVVWWREGSRFEQMVDSWEIQPDNDQARSLRVNQIL